MSNFRQLVLSRKQGGHIAAAVACGLLLIAFAALSWTAVRGKNATFDEPNDSMEGWIATCRGDYRISPADPPLAYYWAAIPQSKHALRADFDSPHWKEAAHEIYHEHAFSTDTLYRTPGNDADAFIARSRAMMLLLGIALGLLICLWAWRIGGAPAAMAATALFCFDPNLLAHSPLVKNDVAVALVFVAMVAVTWTIGRKATPARVALLGLLCGAALGVKFNGLVLGPAIAAALIARALLPIPWPVLGRNVATQSRRLAYAAGICIVCLLISYPAVWACYRFRFGSSPDPSVHLESEWVADRYVALDRSLTHEGGSAAARKPVSIQLVLFIERHHLLPEPWTNGFIRNMEGTRARDEFLLGQFSKTGWWYYFPLAVLFKTPIATLAAMGIAGWLLLRRFPGTSAAGLWTAACLLIPALVYAAAAVSGNLNLGIRHLLPIYPFAFLAIGVAFAGWLKRARRAAVWVATALAAGLAVESLLAFPNYIPFFNVACGGSRGGLSLLSDSNIDWGQDLNELLAWQRVNPDRPLYISYFGTADPNYYGLRYTNLPGSMAPAPKAGDRTGKPLAPNAIWAISATNLQGTYLPPETRRMYAPFLATSPIEVLGGSIYLYDLSKP